MKKSKTKHLEFYNNKQYSENYHLLQNTKNTHPCEKCGHHVLVGYICIFCPENHSFDTSETIKNNHNV